ncbi:MAG: hypothetical protein SFY66_10935 [Oculatellaceae cyanobacterium bins.114]|nr:hypothetical protein [Oculatellaceae cyanobacterium bins.114]
MAKKQQGGFGFGHLINPFPWWSETTAMTDHTSFVQVNPDPRILTLLVIGTEDNVRAHILRQHTLGVIEAGQWSRLLPVPNCPDKVMSVHNRVMV